MMINLFCLEEWFLFWWVCIGYFVVSFKKWVKFRVFFDIKEVYE